MSTSLHAAEKHEGFDELGEDQEYVWMLYSRLDDLRAEASARLAGVLAYGASGTHRARSERDSLAAMRATGVAPWTVQVASAAELAAGLPDLVARENAAVGDGRRC